MKVMLDTGATQSFITKTALTKTKHLPLNNNQQHYLMADGYTTFKVVGLVKIFIDINQIKTNIVVGVVDSLCTDCILGMNFINKYKVNINNKNKQIEIYTSNNKTTISMDDKIKDIITPCHLLNNTCIYPYQENTIKITLRLATGELLFSPAHQLIHKENLIIPHSFISIVNHIAWITVYNPTSRIRYLKSNTIIGTASFISSTKLYCYHFRFTAQHINTLLTHIEDQQQLKELLNVLKKHHSLFDTSKTTIAQTSMSHLICTGDNPPTTSKPYPQTIEKQNATYDTIQQMLKNKQIRASHSQYSAPVLLIKKRDGSYRFIVDYRKLNHITVQDNYPLPNLEQTIQIVGGCQHYTKLDLRSGYFQIPIREDDKHKTAFITVHGLYEFNVLAQGLKNSSPSFQRIMSNLLSPCKKFCLVYLDDILIFSNSFTQHVIHLNQVLAILNKHKFQLNPQKCELARTMINYLGHTISAERIEPLQERIEKILAIPQPRSLNQANAFIGAIGWYRKFINNYAKIAAPILAVTNLTKKNKHKFQWDTPQKEAFNELKIMITSKPLFLTYPDPHAPLILSTDASDYCIGGVLYQEINGERKNIYFHSQMLPKLQRKWPTIEKEALAIYYCVIRMKLYLLGREFIIQTDHCPLRDMHKKPSNNRRADRISLILQQYNIKEIRHVSGKCNCIADYLSRYPRQVEDDDEFFDPDFGYVPAIPSETTNKKASNNVVHSSSTIGAVITRAQAKAKVLPISSNHSNITTNTASLLDDQPRQEEGHEFDVLGIVAAQKQDKLYQGKTLEIKNNTTKYRRKPVGLLHPLEPPLGPFQLIGIDFSGPFPITPQGNKYVLAITDYFTKWVIAIPLVNQTAQTTAEILYEYYICNYGVPNTIISDQGPHFNNQLITAFTKILGCHHIKSTPYHPQTNGAIERFNSTFERQIAKLTDQCINDWDIHLKSIVFAYNTGQHATTKFSPYELQFGRKPKLPPEKPPSYYEFSKPNDYFKFLQQTIQRYHNQARNNMKINQSNYKKIYDKNRLDIHYNPGDFVLKRLSTFPTKLSARYSNPMIVLKQQHPTYWIQDSDDKKIFQVHVSQLRTCNISPSI
ncbi:unnamed protein product [Rotaria socialis]|uniref:RNA-directed DNA polymerase n=5 Tax=Rotaria socialis TaxID=392032 RepID=A0A820TZ44_9BILA|nr:unnamed protein product [Rotaria socialis]CAF4469020.1 unnamed protein product [Rotaria socialis]CAF4483158.1 unnamed protein product [Rotaria socialis]CAF4835063.1 unnamed protein product [Rotaria socialis]